jgi:transposase-like protein
VEEHLGYEKHAAEGRDGGNSRNGTRSKKVITEESAARMLAVEIDVPRDRDGSFEPKTVRKRQRRLQGVDSMVISLCAKGLTTGEVQAHLAEVYGTEVSRETISKITDAVLEEMTDWLNRPLDRVYPVVFIDAIVVKVRDGQVTNRPFYAAIGVTIDGKRDILGIWAGSGGEGAKYWLQVLTEIKNRGTDDVCMVVCDGLKGLPDAIETTWPMAITQTCVLHLIRNTFRLASRRDWDKMAKDLRPVYTAINEDQAKERLIEFHAVWGETYPAIRGLWENAWAEFVPFLDYSPEIRRVIYSTNPIESLHARFRRATRARGHFPNEQAGWIQPVSATPPIEEVMYGKTSDSRGGPTRILGRCPVGHGDRRRGCRGGRVKDGRDALVLACWRGDARTVPSRPISDQAWSAVVRGTRGNQLPPCCRRQHAVDRQSTQAFALDDQP